MNVTPVSGKEYALWLQPQLPPKWEAVTPYNSVEQGMVVIALHDSCRYVLRAKKEECLYKVSEGYKSCANPLAPTPAAAIAAWEMTR